MTWTVNTLKETFGLTDREDLFTELTDDRFNALVNDPQNAVYEVDQSSNNYGEFLFVTIGRDVGGKTIYLTAYGMGYKEASGRWITATWQFYSGSNYRNAKPMPKATAVKQIEAARQEALKSAKEDADRVRTKEQRAFEFIAELTDDDGAWAELQDIDLDDFDF